MDILTLLQQPLFWILSSITSVVLSVVANIITPHVSGIFSQYSGKLRQTREQEKRQKRAEVIWLHENIQTRVNTQLVAIYWLLRSVELIASAVIVILIIPQILFIPTIAQLIVFFLAAVILVRSSQWFDTAKNRIRPALLADERECALRQYKVRHTTLTEDDIQKFLAEWDRKHFGVDSDH